jgi:hypothetical protein
MANSAERYRPAASHEIKARACALAYLGDANKIMVALANEYGAYRPLPSRAYIEEIIARRREGRSLARPEYNRTAK